MPKTVAIMINLSEILWLVEFQRYGVNRQANHHYTVQKVTVAEEKQILS